MERSLPIIRRAPKHNSTLAPTWEPIRKQDVTTAILERIKSLLESGQLKPNSKLPPERQLAEMLKVSRPSLRQALKSLSLMGVVKSKIGNGTYIGLSASSGLTESLHISLLLQTTPLVKVVEARRVVEVPLAGLAAVNASEEQLARLDRLVEALKMNIEAVEAYNQLDKRFHIAVAEAAGNDVLVAVSSVLQRLASVGRQQTAYRYDRSKSSQEHWGIAQSIRSRNVERAKEAMRVHLDGVLGVVLKSDVVQAKDLEAEE